MAKIRVKRLSELCAPCMSFDVVEDELGQERDTFPMTCSLIAGAQSTEETSNEVVLMKLYNLHGEKKNKVTNEDDDVEEQGYDLPMFQSLHFIHQGHVNRIRCMVINTKRLAATWSDDKSIRIWDLTEPLDVINCGAAKSRFRQQKQKPCFTFSGHDKEGFAVDWSRTEPGTLATGDTKRNIYVWKHHSGSSFTVNSRPLLGHLESVEDLQWSPTDTNTLASCSVDKSIRIWDVRCNPQKACVSTIVAAHASDIDVISWNRVDPYYLASGGNDKLIKIWDIRKCKPGHRLTELPAVLTLSHHRNPITSVEWSTHKKSVLAASGQDNQLTLWDIAKAKRTEDDPGLPAQLLFTHFGQHNLKELHWHPQLPGVVISTALNEFNLFRANCF